MISKYLCMIQFQMINLFPLVKLQIDLNVFTTMREHYPYSERILGKK